jgi:unsaturated pyranuronate lyase
MIENFITTKETGWQAMGAGVRRQILGHGPDLMMVRVDFEKGAIGALHQHPHRQVTYVAAGRFEASVNGTTRTLEAGDCFFVAADQPHGVVALEAGTLVDVFTPTREDFLK